MTKTTFEAYLTKTSDEDERKSARLMRFKLSSGVAVPTLYKVLRREPVSRRVALEISEATAGAVSPSDLVFPNRSKETENDQP